MTFRQGFELHLHRQGDFHEAHNLCNFVDPRPHRPGICSGIAGSTKGFLWKLLS
jgi:hypothetical protein